MKYVFCQRRSAIWAIAVALGIFAHSAAGSGGEDGSVRASRKPALSDCCDRNSLKDFDTLDGAANNAPEGIWSDGKTMWVADFRNDKIYAYDVATSVRDSANDFSTLDAAGNDKPTGIWSDGTTMWVADDAQGLWFEEDNDKIYAYVLATRARDPSKDFNSLNATGNDDPEGIWSDGTTMWVADQSDEKLYAYDVTTGNRVRTRDFNTLEAAGNDEPTGIWSDGTTMWVADVWRNKIYAYSMTTKARDPGKDFDALEAAGNDNPTGIWSDGRTMWVADALDDKIYAYNMPSGGETTSAVTDFNGDGKTDFIDFFLFADAYGGTNPRFDLDGNGVVDFADFFKFIDAFGS